MIARPIFFTTIIMLIAAEAVFACSHLSLENGYTGGGTFTVFKKVGVDTSLNLRIFNPPGWSKTNKRIDIAVIQDGWSTKMVDKTI